MSACTPDTPEPGAGASVAVMVGQPTAATVEITVKTQGIKEFAYVQRDSELGATAILAGGEKVTIENTDVASETKVNLQGLEPSTSYKVFFAFRQADNKIYDRVECAEFTTGNYGDNVLTVVEQKLDGFAVHIQIPNEVKERKNALRYSTSSLPMYNYSKKEGSMEIDMLLYNAGQFTTKDKTVRYDEDHNYERDENGNLVENGASFADPKVPGEPGVFLVGEYGYMDDPNEGMLLVDYEGDGTFDEVVSVFDNDGDDLYDNVEQIITPESRYSVIWSYPAGWQKGYYRPMYDFVAWANERGTADADDEKYWNGYYEKLYVNTLEPETLQGNVDIKVTNLTPIDATVTFTADEDVMFYNIFICTESEYETQVMPLLDNNEDHLRWFVGSYFAMMSFGTQVSTDPVSSVHLNHAEWSNGWFVDTKGLAGQDIRVMVAGMGDQEGKTQCFNSYKFTMPEVTLPKPEVVVTPIDTKNPYTVAFNIKNPNWATNPITEAYFACNYVREFDQILKQYSYTDLLKSMGNPLHGDQNAMEAINSDAGFNFIMSSRENATTRLALLVYNWEGSGNNPDESGSPAVAEYTTPNANYPTRVESDLFEKLQGEWIASAPMKNYVAEKDAEGNSTGNYTYSDAGTFQSPVTIMGGLTCPSTMPEEVWAIYKAAGITRDKAEELYDELVSLTKWYNNRTRGFNRLLCLGYNFADAEYLLDIVATPYDLFIMKDYSVSKVSYMFYDFGPKWNLEIDDEGKVWLPINIEMEYPLEAFNFGLEYTLYMLAVGESYYLGGDLVDAAGNTTLKARFPVEVSADYNTITIKPIEYTDPTGLKEFFYPCVAQLTNGKATPVNPRVKGDVVLKRNTTGKAVKANAPVANGVRQTVSSLGKAPVPMARPQFTMTPMENIKPIKRNVLENKIEPGVDAYHKRATAAVKAYFGAKQ